MSNKKAITQEGKGYGFYICCFYFGPFAIHISAIYFLVCPDFIVVCFSFLSSGILCFSGAYDF